MFETKLITDFIGVDKEDDDSLKKMAEFAKKWLLGKVFCKDVVEIRFGDGFGDIVASFLCKIILNDNESTKYVWVICGDFPIHYFGINHKEIRDGEAAIIYYFDMLMEWAEGVLCNKEVVTNIEIDKACDIEYANGLIERMNFIAKMFMGEI